MILGDLRTSTLFTSRIVGVPRRPLEYLSAPAIRCAFIAHTEEVLDAVGSTWEGHTTQRGELGWTVQRDAGTLEEGRYLEHNEKSDSIHAKDSDITTIYSKSMVRSSTWHEHRVLIRTTRLG